MRKITIVLAAAVVAGCLGQWTPRPRPVVPTPELDRAIEDNNEPMQPRKRLWQIRRKIQGRIIPDNEGTFMLCIKPKVSEIIHIGDTVSLRFYRRKEGGLRVAINAPDDVKVWREPITQDRRSDDGTITG